MRLKSRSRNLDFRRGTLESKPATASWNPKAEKWRPLWFESGSSRGECYVGAAVVAKDSTSNGPTQLGDGTTTNSTVPSKVGGNW